MIYISGGMSGIPDYRMRFENAARLLADAGHKVLNPCDFEGGYDWHSWMRICIARMMSEAEGVAYLDGWQYSRGAQIEIALAGMLNMPVRSVGEWVCLEKELIDYAR